MGLTDRQMTINEEPRVIPADREVLDRLTRIETKLDHAISGVDDHEKRIRALERARWPLPSLAALVSLVSVVLAVLAFMQNGA